MSAVSTPRKPPVVLMYAKTMTRPVPMFRVIVLIGLLALGAFQVDLALDARAEHRGNCRALNQIRYAVRQTLAYTVNLSAGPVRAERADTAEAIYGQELRDERC
jgi:hypothetical protein